MTRGGVLVVEDNPVTRRLVATALRKHGFDVLEAADGITALELFESRGPDLALIDIMLPDISGWDVAEALHQRTEDVPLLALTGCLSKVDEGRLSSSAFSDVVTKPVDVSQLLSTVRAYLPETAAVDPGDLTGRRILVADDDAVQRKLLLFHLKRLGCQAEGVADGAEALALARQQRPDAIVSDVMMPRLDGFGLCMAIRQDPLMADLPIVLTTSTYFDAADRALGERAGADAFVTRTPQMVELIAAIRSVLQRPRVHAQPPPPELSREHAARLLRQLERQVSRNARLSQHCATLSAELSVLRSISEGLAHSADMEQALKQALVACFDAGGVATGAIVLGGGDGRFRFWTPLDSGDAFARAFELDERQPLLRRWVTGEQTAALSSATATDTVERELLEREGLESLVAVPMRHADEPLGALVLCSKSSGLIDRERTLFAEAIAHQIAVALTVKRAFETLEQRVLQRTSELQAAQAEAERASQAKTSFLSAVSHDLRTPLNAILGFAQLLEREDDPDPDHAEGVRQILSAGHHLLDLINEVLDITRIESGHLKLTLAPVESSAAIDEALELIRPLASRRDLVLRVERSAAPVVVKADGQRLKQVLLNLLSNAVKYNRDGGAVTVTRTITASGRCRIAVADTGRGIAADKQSLLFTPFQRLGAEATAIEGTGLGLSLAHALARQMGGALGVVSEEGTGSTFWIDLPLHAGAAPALVAARSTPATATAPPPASQGVVLYVEDNVANLRLVERMLGRRAGVTLQHAATGAAAVAMIAAQVPDLVLLDLQLPDMPGGEVLRRLRDLPGCAAVPVIVLTADAAPELPERLAAAGATGFMTKPLDVKQMLGTIDASLAIGG